MDGAAVVAKALSTQGVEYMFGIVGIPVMEIAIAAQQTGIKYIGMRNEQAASYAASVIGYLTGRPAVCLVVSGPGLVHALAGMSNSKENCWPFLVIAGSSDRNQEQMGAFQELPQVEAARQYCKFSARPNRIEDIPKYVEKAIRCSIQGRPGVSFIDLPGDMIRGSVKEENRISWTVASPPSYSVCAPDENIIAALNVLEKARRPLVIIGKGAAYGRAEVNLRTLIELLGIPFLPTPMGKGVVPDSHPLCVAAARSRALQRADVILLVGARLNWILHFGKVPRFSANLKLIQIDICPEELGNNVQTTVGLVGDINSISHQMIVSLKKMQVEMNMASSWWNELGNKIKENKKKTELMIANSVIPMNFYKMYHEMNKLLPKDCIIINEGANTMDIGRTMLSSELPRHRLDAGSFGTMGVGVGFAIAACLYELSCATKGNTSQAKKVVCIQGDSAFGFSGMELETAARYQLPIVFVVANNNGIYNGVDCDSWHALIDETNVVDLPLVIPPVCLNPHCKYEQIMRAFDCPSYNVISVEDLHDSLGKALAETRKPSLLHVEIESTSQRKPQEFEWLTKSNL